MRWIRAVVLVFSTYSRIRLPKARWDNDASVLAIAFLPLVGGLVGCAVWGWQALCNVLGLSAVLFAAVTVVLPIIITGGIHMDGYCDTSDALASWQGRERALEILKDPNVGAFAVIRFGAYILISFAVFYELYISGYDAGIGFSYIVSRCLAVWSAMTMPNARKDGMLVAFTEKLDRRAASIVLTLLTVVGLAGWIFFTFPRGIMGLVLCLPVMLRYRHMAMVRFGGVTGDTTGYCLQMIELVLPVGLLVGGVIFKWV